VIDPRYQIVDEQRMADVLVTECWPHEPLFGDGAAFHAAALGALARWRQEGLPFRDDGGDRRYDPRDVLNFMKEAYWSRGDRVWPAAVASHRRDLRALNLGRAGARVHSPARFEVRFRREFNLETRAPGALVRLRVPAPFEDRAQRDIEVEVEGPAGAQIERGPGRIEVRLPVPEERSCVAVELRTRLTASCETVVVDPACLVPADPGDPEVQLYTRPNEGFIRVSDRVAAKARELADGANAWETLQAFWDFFFRTIKLGSVHPDEHANEIDRQDPLGALLDGGWVDCVAGSALLIALCRARGIPARLVSGIGLDVDAPGTHYWAEILLPPHGWFPVDLMSWDLACGDRLSPWSRHYFGHMDHRMKTQCLPHIFTGHVGVSWPASWYALRTRTGDTTEIAHYELPHRLIYRDLIRVTDR
jgi:transglutaminase-like putative cysteine protease